MFCSRGGGEDSKSVDGGAARLRAEVEEGTVWHATMPPFEAGGTLGLTDSFRNNANNSSSSMLSSGGASGSKSGDGSAAPPGTVVSSSPSGPFAEWLDVRDVATDAAGGVVDAGAAVPFADAAQWEVLLDVPGGGWSGRLKFLPLLGRPLVVIDRREWDWISGAVLRPYNYVNTCKYLQIPANM